MLDWSDAIAVGPRVWEHNPNQGNHQRNLQGSAIAVLLARTITIGKICFSIEPFKICFFAGKGFYTCKPCKTLLLSNLLAKQFSGNVVMR